MQDTTLLFDMLIAPRYQIVGHLVCLFVQGMEL
jgi:hypothetical protein